MALSFEDSLNKTTDTETTISSEAEVMSLSLDRDDSASVASVSTFALSSSNDGWEIDYDYPYFTAYEDDNISSVDADKNITLNPKQINITQEENSQYIPFEMPKVYDGFDLSDTVISIHYTTSDEYHAAATPVNVKYSGDKIRFGWLVDSYVTHVAGNIQFEIQATGSTTDSNGNSYGYTWKSKPNGKLNVLQSICNSYNDGEGIELDDTWVTTIVEKVADKVAETIASANIDNQVAQANSAAKEAKDAATEAKQYAANASTAVENAMNAKLVDYATKTYVDDAIADVDVSSQLGDYAKTSDIYNRDQADAKFATKKYVDSLDISDQLTGYSTTAEIAKNYYNKNEVEQKVAAKLDGYATKDYVATAIANEDITGKLTNYYTKAETYSNKEIDEKLENVNVDLTDYATKTYVDGKVADVSSSVETNTSNISSLGTTIAELQQDLNSVDKSPRLTYDVAYNDVENTDVGKNVFVLYEIENEGKDNEIRSAKKKFTIVGGGGSGATSSTLKIGYITTSPVVATINDKVVIKYTFSGTDSSGDQITQGNATWKIDGKIVATNIAIAGENSFDVPDNLSVGTHKVNLTITDDAGSLVTKNWTVQKIDVRLESTFNDKLTYPIGNISFDYTPYGAVEKTVHFVLDGVEIGTVTTSTSGIPMAYEIPAQTHGAHLFEAYMTATINGNTIESNHIVKDIIWYDSESIVPVIGCTYQEFTAKQYDSTGIVYTVYDPSTESPVVTLAVNGEVVSTLTLDSNTQTWMFKSTEQGTYTLTITCGETVKTLTANIEKLDIDVSPETDKLAFDFNPSGKSNNDADRLWSYGDISMTVSDNFDWVNGGYQIDENGDQYFCIKSGTSATIDYKLFEDDAKKFGKEFKIVFKTTNVAKSDATFLTCMSDTDAAGLVMNVHEAYINSSVNSLYSPYSEEDIIEWEFNINKNTDIRIVMTYEDGTPCRPISYTDSYSFTQDNPAPIVIGSPDCDVMIYRMKAYSKSLAPSVVLNNFIADARNAEDIVDRYNRNQIRDEYNNLTPESVAKALPHMRVIKIDAPTFTTGKKSFIRDTSVECIYENGDKNTENWKFTNCYHAGQGTTSNEYGAAGRNIDVICCFDGIHQVNDKIDLDPDYKTCLTLGTHTDSTKTEVIDDGTGKVALTENSVPNNWFNIKVNIASSEMCNNAQLQNRYNTFLPYKTPASRRDPRVKNAMEFVNCVVFIRENDPDISKHTEFQDTEWHYYALGNIGDSKKTDNSRAYDKDDMNEFTIEISDNTLPNSIFQTGVNNPDGSMKYPISKSEWVSGNTAYDSLYNNWDGSFEFRYDCCGDSKDGSSITSSEEIDAIRLNNKQVWRDFYEFVITSTDEEFKSELKNWFIKESALFWYLFTSRYIMIDNRAKNTFWHWAKHYISTDEVESLGEKASYYIVDDDAAAINGGYRFDLWDYDNDTALGINNSGELTMTYGKEDVDYRTEGDASSGYVFNAAESVFFCRVRDLMEDELKKLYVSLETSGCWSAESLINQFDKSQNEWCEALWVVDYERKYERPYRDGNTRFLEQMMNGKKKYQRRQFERDQEIYIGTKYIGNNVASDQIMIRCNTPEQAVVKPDYTMHITPFSNMYLTIMFGNTSPVQIRAKAGQKYDIECPFTKMDDTAILIYAASRIQSVGDLSACYTHDNDFSKATRIKEIIIGNNTEGYSNVFLTNLSVGENNKLLERLDIRNTPNLQISLNLSGCSNLRELYADGSGIKDVSFANGGNIRTASLPDTLTSISLKNLLYLADFSIAGYDFINKIVFENSNIIDIKDLLEKSSNVNRVRIVGIDLDLEDTSLLKRIYKMHGIDKNNYDIAQSVLTGSVHVPVIRQQQLYDYQKAWPDLEVTFNSMINQYAVTFVNADGTVLDVQYVDEGGEAVDPITREINPIPIPTKESTVSTEFTYNGWDSSFVNIYSARTITATYTETTRSYTVKYVSMGYTMQETTALYGSYVEYQNETPTYTLAEESAHTYYLFNRWDKSGLVDGDKTITAVFDSFKYTEDAFTGREFSDLSPVEIYALTKLGLDNVSSITVEDGDKYSFNLGYDINFDDVESEVRISDRVVFDGSNNIDTGIKLFDEDKDFVMAIDYKFLSGNIDDEYGNMLLHCYNESVLSGFKLYYMGDSARFKCDSTEVSTVNRITSSSSETNREMLVIRHKKGSGNITIYKSDTDSVDGVSAVEFAMPASTAADCTLVLGCGKFGSDYSNNSFANVDWFKIWYGDIGEESCKKIACWPHEKVNMEVCGLKKYFLSDGSGNRCNITMIGSNLMNRTMRYNKTSTTANAWADSDLCNFLNTRIYDAMPTQMKAIIKNVIVHSSVGNKSTDIKPANCYVYIPAIRELSTSSTFKAIPYSNEAGYTISYMVPQPNMSDDDMRKRAPIDGDYAAYWTRSPNIQNANYMWQITSSGSTNGYVSSSGLAGVLIQISL